MRFPKRLLDGGRVGTPSKDKSQVLIALREGDDLLAGPDGEFKVGDMVDGSSINVTVDAPEHTGRRNRDHHDA